MQPHAGSQAKLRRWLREGLILLALLAGAMLLMDAWRAPQLSRGGVFEPVSRESLLLLNNALFSVAAAAVMLGTLYPLVLDALARMRFGR